jgi:hypothetical protein
MGCCSTLGGVGGSPVPGLFITEDYGYGTNGSNFGKCDIFSVPFMPLVPEMSSLSFSSSGGGGSGVLLLRRLRLRNGYDAQRTLVLGYILILARKFSSVKGFWFGFSNRGAGSRIGYLSRNLTPRGVPT